MRMSAEFTDRAIGYIRLSDWRGKEDPSTSPARQRDVIRSYCQAKGWDLVEIVEDLDVSGSDRGLRLDREGLAKVRALYPRADHLVIPAIDRLARNTSDFLTVAEEAQKHSVALVSVKESLDMSTPNGRFVATILAAFAQMEAETIRARVLDGIERVKMLGRYAGGNNLPYGYRSESGPDGGKILVPDPEQAAIVREAAERVLSGETTYAVTRDLNARGVRSKTGKDWSIQAVRQMLTGPAIVGRITHRGEVVRDADGLPLQAFEPILSLESWRSLRSLLEVDKPTAQRTPRKRATRLLSGIVSCGRCGGVMYPATSGGGKSYRCSTASRGGDCVGVSIRCEPLEAMIEDEFLRRWGHLPVTVRRETVPPEPAELVEIEHAIRETASAMASDDADVVALAERLAALKGRRADLRSAPAEPVVEEVETGRSFREVWEDDETDVAVRRQFLERVLVLVAVAPGRAGRRPFAPERVTVEWLNDYLSAADLD